MISDTTFGAASRHLVVLLGVMGSCARGPGGEWGQTDSDRITAPSEPYRITVLTVQPQRQLVLSAASLEQA